MEGGGEHERSETKRGDERERRTYILNKHNSVTVVGQGQT